MPIQTLDLIYQGPTDFPEIDFDGTFDAESTNTNDGLGGSYVFSVGYGAIDVFYTNSGLIASGFTTVGNNNAVLLNTSTGIIGGGSPFSDGTDQGSIKMTGLGTHLMANLGDVFADIQMGNGQDGIYNTGLIDGTLRMGGGQDYFINDVIEDSESTVTGTVNMGSGDDVVLNAGQMGRVNLGSGNDSYSAINPGDIGSNFNNVNAVATRVAGGTGDDKMLGGAGVDRFYGGADNDKLSGHNGNDKLYGGTGQDSLNGGNDNDRLFGGDGKDRLNGGNGNDMLNGGTGEDVLIGGKGNDRMMGGSGSDEFVFSGNSGKDIITDFDVDADVVSLENIILDVELELGFHDGGAIGAYGDEDLLSYITYNNGNAVLDLSGLYKEFGISNADGIKVTFLNVEAGSLTGDNFVTPQDLNPFPEFYELV